MKEIDHAGCIPIICTIWHTYIKLNMEKSDNSNLMPVEFIFLRLLEILTLCFLFFSSLLLAPLCQQSWYLGQLGSFPSIKQDPHPTGKCPKLWFEHNRRTFPSSRNKQLRENEIQQQFKKFKKKRKRGRLDKNKTKQTKREKGKKQKKEDTATTALTITNSLKVETVMT